MQMQISGYPGYLKFWVSKSRLRICISHSFVGDAAAAIPKDQILRATALWKVDGRVGMFACWQLQMDCS